MPRYNFASLSSQDFEELVRDLLQAEWNVPLEAFRTGRDTGIDLRYAAAEGGATIIQCKHYAGSGFSKLLAHLRDTERPKIERLAPSRYLVATSVGLTPPNKDELVGALHPFVRSTGDVLGAQDIEGLLSKHPAVERANFKLWLTSTSVLERVLHNAEVCQTQFEVDRIRRKLPLFVQNDAFPRAMDLLDQTRIAVISGVPGIGKTTLAEMLLYAHLEQGYEPVVIRAEIAEGKKLFKADAKQIFYYDDFLGQTFLGDRREYLGRNEDVAIVDFMEMVRQSEHGRFILTTREHILRNALQISERLAHSRLLGYNCILELRDYSYAQKARILYNHLYFSSLSQPYKDAVLQDRFFLTIIKHEHFNPRLIEWLSAESRLRAVAPEHYQAHIEELLDSPHSIWAHAFHHQISEAARHVLLCVYTLGDWTETRDLEPAFVALHRHAAEKYHQAIGPGDFRGALQELDGAFLTYTTGHASFLNPSIREFVASVISADRSTAEDLLASAVRFKQLASLWQLAEASPTSALASYLASGLNFFSQSASRLIEGPSLRWEKAQDGSRRGYSIDMGREARIGFLVNIAESQRSALVASRASQAVESLVSSWKNHVPEFSAVLDLLGAIHASPWYLAHGGHEAYRALLDGMLGELSTAYADDWLLLLPFPAQALEWTEDNESTLARALAQYCEDGVYTEMRESTTLDEVTTLRDSLSELVEKFGLDLRRIVSVLDEDIAERVEDRDEYSEGTGYRERDGGRYQAEFSDEDVAEMFNTLREGN